MSDNAALSASLLLMLVALPVLSAGTWNDVTALWVVGLVLLALGALIPPVMRFAGGNGADGGGDDGGGEP
jgi:hypothetical protein